MSNISVIKTLAYLRDNKFIHLANYLDDTRNLCPKKDRELWREQIAVNIPILYLASIYLNSYVKEHNLKHLLFATRDCIHWCQIYKVMYPQDDVHYFHCSRNMFNKARVESRPDYDKYIQTITQNDIRNSIYIDIHGTGRRMYEYFSSKKQGPSCFILSSGHSKEDKLCDGIKKLIRKDRAKFLVFGAAGSPIEMLNYDIIGTCNDYTELGPVRAEVEYDINLVLPYHECVAAFIKIFKSKQKIDVNDNILEHIEYLFEPILDDLPVISKWIKPERIHNNELQTNTQTYNLVDNINPKVNNHDTINKYNPFDNDKTKP